MRLLHVTHQYRPAIGGAEQYIVALSEELACRGHQVDVFTSRSLDYRTWRNELSRREQLDGVDVYRFTSIPRVAHTWRVLQHGYEQYWRTNARRYQPLIWYGNGPVCPGMFAAIARNGHRYDLVHINNLHYAHALIGAAAARLRRLPFVITPHLHMDHRVTYDVGYMRRILDESQLVFAQTEGEKEFIVEQGWGPSVVGGVGLQMENFPELDRATCRARFSLPSEGFVMLFLGRKTEYKGLDLCLKAFAALRRQRKDIYFLAVGPETDDSRRLWADHRGLEGLVVREQVSDEERLAALASCDVLALPSTGEAFGIVYLEAWAYGKPVIGARIRSVASLIDDGEDGFLIEPGDVDGLIQALTSLTGDPLLGPRMGERGRRKLERRYTMERITDIVEATCARVLRRHRTQSTDWGKNHAC